MMLLILLMILILPYALLTLLGRWIDAFRFPRSTRARIGLSLFFLFTAIGHFVKTEEMSLMLPGWVPYRVEMIYFTGVLEFLGAIGIWIPRLMKFTGWCLIVFLICILPSNIYAAINKVPFGGHEAGLTYLIFRIPFQLLLIWWTYGATQNKEEILMTP